ncbi:MAG: hypothetical protein KBS74_01230 [Clostridiales bacterium]|nr:hypothetical protein [Candidatus Cacconaster stercorequi]
MKFILEHRTAEIIEGNIHVKDVPYEELNDMEHTARSLLLRIRELIRKKRRYDTEMENQRWDKRGLL